MSRWRTRVTYANVISTLALFIALGGSSYAALTVTGKNVKNSSLTGKDLKNGSVTGADVKSLTPKDFAPGQLPAGPRGAAGAQGAQGPKGDAGESATRLWASVNPDGTLRRGSGVVSASRFPPGGNTGFYLVTFDRVVFDCARTGTVANPGGESFDRPSIHLTGVTGPGSNPVPTAGVVVRTQDAAGATTDLPFDLAVFC